MCVTLAERLESRRLLSAALVLTGAPANNAFYLAEDSSQTNINIWQNSPTPGTGTPTQSVAISQISQIIINSQAGNDTVTQGTFLPKTVLFNGGTGNDTLNISTGVFTIAGDPGATTANLTINDSGSLFFTAGAAGSGIHPIHLAALNISAGASVTIDTPESASDRAVMVLGSLSIAATGSLDLTGNDLIVHNGNLPAITNLLVHGFNSPGVAWKGSSGITSSLAAADASHLSSLGMILNQNNSSPLYTVFDSQPVVMSDVLIKFTFAGDANLDGKVDGTDYSRIDSATMSGAKGWFNGDFNYDGTIDGSDYTLIDNAYNSAPSYVSPLVYQLNNARDVAAEQSKKTIGNLGSSTQYPQYVNADGSLSLVPNNHWTAGTWPGLLWNLYQATGNSYYLNQAIAFTNPLQAADTQTSDVGFRIYDSFYPLLQQEPGNTAVINILLTAAASKATQYNSTVGAFEAWRTSTSGNPAANFNVLMDLIMDSQLLFWAATQTGNQTYYNEAVSNAAVEETYLVNADTGRADFLATSEKTANWFISHLPSDDVPYWDFNAPEPTYRDTSAAAVGASGLLKLSALIKTSDPVNSAKYRSAAAAILQSLASTSYLANPMTADNGVLLHGALNVPATPSIADNSINFGDYYFTEAINEYLQS
jgi:hypothetical protein